MCGGRLGIDFDRLLVYGTVGGAVANFTETLNATSATPWGWTAGLGADFAVSDRMFLRVDWAYQNYGNFALNPGFTATNVTANTVTAGLGFKFSRSAGAESAAGPELAAFAVSCGRKEPMAQHRVDISGEILCLEKDR